MTGRLGGRVVRFAAAGALGATLLAGTSGATPAPLPPPARSDALASAHPTAADPTVREQTVRTASILGLRPRADAVATTSATCKGCRGTAVSVQVVEVVGGWRAQADNVATAWARCRTCSAEAVSVQLVLLRRAAELTTNNRALAVNGDCQRCTSRAAAYQVVLQQGDEPADLDRLRDEVLTWVEQQPGVTEPGPRSRAGSVTGRPRHLLADLEHRVGRLVDGAVLRSRAAVRTE